MERLDGGSAVPDRISRRDRRARQFRWLSPGATRRWSAARVARAQRRGAAGAGRDLRSASGALLQARCAAVPADHARPARSGCSPRRAPMRCWCSISTPALAGADRRGVRRPSGWSADRRGAASSPARISPSARRAAATSRVLAELGAAHGFRAETVGAGDARRRAGLVQPHPRRCSQAGDPRDAARAADAAVRDRGHGRAWRQARPRRSAIPPPICRLGNYLRPRLRHLCGARAAGRRARAGRRGQSGHPAELRSAEGTARALFLRFFGRSLRPDDRGRS